MTVSFLEWDSNFFNRAIAKIDIGENEEVDFNQTIEGCKNQGYKLLYVFVDSRNIAMKAKAVALWGTAINEKIILEKTDFVGESAEGKLNDKYSVANAATISKGSDFYDRILALTIKAGAFSRFRLDPKLDTQKFVDMYTIWVNMLINDKDYRVIVVKNNQDCVIGFLSYKTIEKGYKIDFMSIDESYKQMGIGKALLQKMYEEVIKGEFKYIVTEIHSANTGAFKFFISNDYTVTEAFEIYHLHL